MKTLKTTHEVFQILKEHFGDVKLNSEMVQIFKAVNRICAEDIYATENVPSFDRSTVDGYALISSFSQNANDENPSVLKIIGEVKTGEMPQDTINGNQCMRISTGGAIPEGADSVVMFENTVEQGDELLIFKPVVKNENVLKTGDDIRKDEVIIKKFQLLMPPQIGMLAAIGITKVNVFEKLKVAIISTGDEIIPIDQNLTKAKIRDINTWVIFSSLLNLNLEPVSYGIVKDDLNELINTLKKAIYDECHIVLISGGSSVGTYDNTLKAINYFEESEILVNGIAIKPGKPTIIGKIGNTAVVGLPGHPLSCFFIFEYIVKKLIQIINHQPLKQKTTKAIMKTNVVQKSGRTEFIFVKLIENENLYAEPLYGKSGMISILNNADGYIRVDASKTGIKANDVVEVFLF